MTNAELWGLGNWALTFKSSKSGNVIQIPLRFTRKIKLTRSFWRVWIWISTNLVKQLERERERLGSIAYLCVCVVLFLIFFWVPGSWEEFLSFLLEDTDRLVLGRKSKDNLVIFSLICFCKIVVWPSDCTTRGISFEFHCIGITRFAWLYPPKYIINPVITVSKINKIFALV